MVSSGALKIPKGDLALWIYMYVCIPSHSSHPWQGSERENSSDFIGNKYNCVSQMLWKKHCCTSSRSSRQTGNSCWGGTVFLFRENRWLQMTICSSHWPEILMSGYSIHISKHRWLLAIYTITASSNRIVIFRYSWVFPHLLLTIHCCYHHICMCMHTHTHVF